MSARGRGGPAATIELVGEGDLADLLPLMRAYCAFYSTAPRDEALLGVSRALLVDPEREGVQLLARDQRGVAVGFISIFWSWDTTEAARIGIMNDLYVSPAARGSGIGARLVQAGRERCARRGATRLEWQTAPGNGPARALYGRIGARQEAWVDFTLAVAGS